MSPGKENLAKSLARWFRGSDAADARAMSRLCRTTLGTYLLVLAIALMVGLLTLISADFGDVPAATSAAPVFTDAEKPADTAPAIKQFDPTLLVATASQPELKVYGYNFTAASRVRMNRIDIPTRFFSDHLLIATPQPVDYLGQRFVDVDVVDQAGTSPAKRLAIFTQTGTVTVLGRNVVVTREIQLMLLAIFAGALGSYLHAIKSMADYIGNRQLTASWFWFYFSRPFVGMALALVFYAAIRGGFVAGSPADAKSVNPFGVVAIAALVGMFADAASQKLKEIFDTLFKTTDLRTDKLTADLEIATTDLPAAAVNSAYDEELTVRGGEPPYRWEARDLPQGLTLEAAEGRIQGTPTAAGRVSFPVKVTDSKGKSVDGIITLTIA